MQQANTINQRIGRFVLLIGMVSVITLIIVVTQRLSNDSLALLIGVFVGMVAMLPTIALGVFLLRREMKAQREVTHMPTPAAMPPVVVVTPQALPGYGVPPNNTIPNPAQYAQPSPWTVTNSQRQFTIVGENANE